MLQVGSATSSITVESTAAEIDTDTSTSHRKDKNTKKAPALPPPTASANVFNLQQRVAGCYRWPWMFRALELLIISSGHWW